MDAAQITQTIADYFERVTGNDYLTLFLLSVIPIVELRGAILLSGGMEVNQFAASLVCIAGSSVIIFPLLFALKPLLKNLKRWRLTKRIAENAESSLADKAERVNTTAQNGKTKTTLETKKCAALFLFVGIPLPLTGAWTGSAVGAILGLPVWKAALCVFCGNVLAAGILSVLVLFCRDYIDIVLISFLAIIAFLALVALWGKIVSVRRKTKAADETRASAKPQDKTDETEG